mmetsp:Transcript_87874/g.221150  ORF Transcript_87874/g.221150 Transcript_87874/m.221150 type:complete len:322 (+) Transcript_87874:402-1367(+)
MMYDLVARAQRDNPGDHDDGTADQTMSYLIQHLLAILDELNDGVIRLRLHLNGSVSVHGELLLTASQCDWDLEFEGQVGLESTPKALVYRGVRRWYHQHAARPGHSLQGDVEWRGLDLREQLADVEILRIGKKADVGRSIHVAILVLGPSIRQLALELVHALGPGMGDKQGHQSATGLAHQCPTVARQVQASIGRHRFDDLIVDLVHVRPNLRRVELVLGVRHASRVDQVSSCKLRSDCLHEACKGVHGDTPILGAKCLMKVVRARETTLLALQLLRCKYKLLALIRPGGLRISLHQIDRLHPRACRSNLRNGNAHRVAER